MVKHPVYLKAPYPHFWCYGLWLPGILIILDQVSKFLMLRQFGLPHDICQTPLQAQAHIDLTPVFDFTLICNQGISYGLLQGDNIIKRWILTLFAIVMSGILFLLLRQTRDTPGRLAFALIIGGALGNAIDRARFGAVIDFINFNSIGFPWVFNIADSAISCGVIGLLLSHVLNHARTD